MSALLTTVAFAASLHGQCLLEVEGDWKLFEGGCEIRMAESGSMSITSDATANEYGNRYDIFVDVTGPKKATGEWKGNWASMNWLNDMGELTRDGACWSNDVSKVCAWR